jgi:hypothetical protein
VLVLVYSIGIGKFGINAVPLRLHRTDGFGLPHIIIEIIAGPPTEMYVFGFSMLVLQSVGPPWTKSSTENASLCMLLSLGFL